LGLPPMEQMRSMGPPKKAWYPEAARVFAAKELEWRRSVGWIDP
jgi:hypothetical protein